MGYGTIWCFRSAKVSPMSKLNCILWWYTMKMITITVYAYAFILKFHYLVFSSFKSTVIPKGTQLVSSGLALRSMSHSPLLLHFWVEMNSWIISLYVVPEFIIHERYLASTCVLLRLIFSVKQFCQNYSANFSNQPWIIVRESLCPSLTVILGKLLHKTLRTTKDKQTEGKRGLQCKRTAIHWDRGLLHRQQWGKGKAYESHFYISLCHVTDNVVLFKNEHQARIFITLYSTWWLTAEIIAFKTAWTVADNCSSGKLQIFSSVNAFSLRIIQISF